ncbi:CGL141 [Auxenochlorella protothecoides x Auxenochlorella symbiontica]
MASRLFEDLPEPSAAREREVPPSKRPRNETVDSEVREEVGEGGSSAPPSKETQATGTEPRGETVPQEAAAGSGAPQWTTDDDEVPPPPPPPPPPPVDGIALALEKIASHIPQPSKLVKASRLLRQLLEQGTLDPEAHGPLVYRALVGSLSGAAAGDETPVALELSKVFTLASKRGQLFTPSQREVLEVLALRGVLRSQLLTTDDSFQFNKVVARLKEAVAALPEEPATLPESEGASEPGIAALLEADAKGAVIAAEVLEGVRRSHLLDCLEAGRVVYRLPWARTSVDLLVDHFRQHVRCFLPAEQDRVAAMIVFVKEQRAARRQGPSAKESNRDTTSFERASAAWSQATVSHRGKVGSGGDHKSENWLG